MNFKTTITLVVLLVLVGLIWWLVPASQQTAAPPTAAPIGAELPRNMQFRRFSVVADPS